MRKFARAVAIALPNAVRDAAGVAGAGLVSYGAWCAYRPAGLIASGLLLLAGAILSARASL